MSNHLKKTSLSQKDQKRNLINLGERMCIEGHMREDRMKEETIEINIEEGIDLTQAQEVGDIINIIIEINITGRIKDLDQETSIGERRTRKREVGHQAVQTLVAVLIIHHRLKLNIDFLISYNHDISF